MQIHEEMERIGKYNGSRITCVYGGSDIERQIRTIKKGIDIIVGTPGRVMDLMRRNVLKLNDVKFVVLDEADEMLNMIVKQFYFQQQCQQELKRLLKIICMIILNM